MVARNRHECVFCNVAVTANFDHVGVCGAGCSGTFEHPRGVCKLAGRDIGHGHVRTTTISDPNIVRRA